MKDNMGAYCRGGDDMHEEIQRIIHVLTRERDVARDRIIILTSERDAARNELARVRRELTALLDDFQGKGRK